MNESVRQNLDLNFTYRDGYYFHFSFSEDIKKPETFVVYTRLKQKDIEYINKHQINNFFINSLADSDVSLKDLLKLDNVEYLAVYGEFDLTPIYQLKDLKYLHVNATRFPSKHERMADVPIENQKIDLSRFPNLEWFSTRNSAIIVNLEQATKLKSLTIYNYNKPIQPDLLEAIPKLPLLDTLVIEGAHFENLDFIKPSMKLKVLYLVLNRRLKNIDAIENLKDTLTALQIFNSSKIQSFDVLAKMNQLRYMSIDTCNKMENINFISKMKAIHTALLIKTNVLDGNLTPLKRTKSCTVIPFKRHYHQIISGQEVKIGDYDLPLGKKRIYGNEEIEEWRRIHYY